MIVRPYQLGDLERVHALHLASGFPYNFPDTQEFFSGRVAENGEIAMAAFMRHTAEVYLICDPFWRTAAWRMEALRRLHRACNEDAKQAGVKEVFAFLPPIVTKKFGRRLKRLGWKFYQDEEWRAFSHEVT